MICTPDYFCRCLSATVRRAPLRVFTALNGGMRRQNTLLLMHTTIVSESAGTSHHHASTVGNCQAPNRQTNAILPIKPLAHERRAATRGARFTFADRSLG